MKFTPVTGSTIRFNATKSLPSERVRGGSRGSHESAFWKRVLETARATWPSIKWVKAIPGNDGHLTSAPYYVTSADRKIHIFDGAYAIRDVASDFNKGNNPRLEVAGASLGVGRLSWPPDEAKPTPPTTTAQLLARAQAAIQGAWGLAIFQVGTHAASEIKRVGDQLAIVQALVVTPKKWRCGQVCIAYNGSSYEITSLTLPCKSVASRDEAERYIKSLGVPYDWREVETQ